MTFGFVDRRATDFLKMLSRDRPGSAQLLDPGPSTLEELRRQQAGKSGASLEDIFLDLVAEWSAAA